MAQTNFTPILIYASSTPTAVPSAGNLINSATGSEIAINIADKNLFFKDSGGVVNTIPIRQSSTSSNGWLSSTDWNTFNNKAPATSGTSILYGNGSGGFSNVTIGTGVSFVGGTLSATGTGGTVTSVTGTAPVVSSGGTTPVISMTAATTSVNGYLTSTDWTTFNGKQAALVSGTNIKTVGGVSLLGAGDVGIISGTYGGTGVNNGANTITVGGNVNYSGAFTQTWIRTANTSLTLPISGIVISTVTNMAANPVTGTPSASNFLRGDGTWAVPTAGSGTVTSVAATVPAFLSIAGSPITTSGTLAITLSGTALPVANGGTGLTTFPVNHIPYGNGTSAFQANSSLQYDGANLNLGNGGTLGFPSNLNLLANGGASAGAFTFKNTAGNNQWLGWMWNNAAGATSFNLFVNFGTDSSFTGRGSITYNSTAGLLSFNTTSDQRLKTNIVDAPSALDKINAIRIRSFNWIETGNHNDFGVIAQELIEVAPEAVTPGDNAKQGQVQRPWSVDTSALNPAMIKAIQELTAKVTALEEQVLNLSVK